MKIRTITAFLALVFSMLYAVDSYGQQTTDQAQKDTEKEAILRDRYNNALGTFQFQIINSRINPTVNASVIELIENNRSDNEITYVMYSEVIRIKILPRNMVQGDFEHLETFIYIKE